MNRIAKVASARRCRNLDKPVSGTSGFLDAGAHDVVITRVDTTSLQSDGYIEFTFEAPAGAKHKQRIWLLQRDLDEYSGPMIALVNALFQDPSVYESLDEQLTDEDMQAATLDSFKGLALQLEIEHTDGYLVMQLNNQYILADAKTGDTLDSRKFDTINDARAAALAKGLTRAFKRTKKYKAGSDETLTDNRARYSAAIKGMRESTEADSHPRQLFNIYALRASTSEGKPTSSGHGNDGTGHDSA